MIRGKDYINLLIDQEIVPKNTIHVVIDADCKYDVVLYYEIYNGKTFSKRMTRNSRKPSGGDILMTLANLGFFDADKDYIQRVVMHFPYDDVAKMYIQRVVDQRVMDLSLGDFSEPEEVVSIQPSIDITLSPMLGVDYLTNEALTKLANVVMQRL